jgi:hypothetical protein
MDGPSISSAIFPRYFTLICYASNRNRVSPVKKKVLLVPVLHYEEVIRHDCATDPCMRASTSTCEMRARAAPDTRLACACLHLKSQSTAREARASGLIVSALFFSNAYHQLHLATSERCLRFGHCHSKSLQLEAVVRTCQLGR